MNWYDVLPPDVAEEQVRYERYRTAWRMHQAGFTYREIGQRLDVCTNRARQLYFRYERRREGPSPAKAYMDSWEDIRELYERMRKSKKLPQHVVWATALDSWTSEKGYQL